jgi:hypothetical protein
MFFTRDLIGGQLPVWDDVLAGTGFFWVLNQLRDVDRWPGRAEVLELSLFRQSLTSLSTADDRTAAGFSSRLMH